MSIQTSCPTCQQRFEVAEEHIGKNARCKKCNSKFRIATGRGVLIGNAAAAIQQAASPDATSPAGDGGVTTRPATAESKPHPAVRLLRLRCLRSTRAA